LTTFTPMKNIKEYLNLIATHRNGGVGIVNNILDECELEARRGKFMYYRKIHISRKDFVIKFLENCGLWIEELPDVGDCVNLKIIWK